MPSTLSLRLAPETPESIVFGRIRRNYGHFARPLGARPDQTDPGKISVPIIAEIPVQITDTTRQESRIAWISLGEVADARFTKTPLTLLDMPSFSTFRRLAQTRYQAITTSVEADMVECAPLQFGEFTFPQFYLKTLRILIGELEDNLEDGIPWKRVESLVGDTNQHEYLLNAGYAKVVSSVDGPRLFPGDNFIAMRGKYDERERFQKHLFGIVFARNYDAITTRLRQVKSFVRSALTYYSASYEYGELIELGLNELTHRYGSLYGGDARRLSSFRQIDVPELCRHDILRRKGRQYSGYPGIFTEFQKRASEKIPVTVRLPLGA